MGLFGFGSRKNMDAYVSQAKSEGATLVDVREPSEFANGHVEGAINIPLRSIQGAGSKLKDKNATLYVYCLSGGRSSRAVATLKSMGYANATNIGGIGMYHGPVVTGK